MADSVINRSLHTRLSRLTGEGRTISHTFPTVGVDAQWPLPSDAVEVVRGTFSEGLYDLYTTIRSYPQTPRSKDSWTTSERKTRAGTMTVFAGPVVGDRTTRNIPKILRDVNRISSNKGRTTLILRDEFDSPLDQYFEDRSVYDFKGYYDWGVSYTLKDVDMPAVGLIPDVAGFWSSDHSIGTILIPGTTTLGGILKAKAVMRKADIMISTDPPYEYLQGVVKDYPEEAVRRSLLVSEARKIWDPDTHFFSGTKEIWGKLLGRDDQRMLTLGGRKDKPVVRWSRGDLEKGPIDGPEGYPVNNLYYTTN